MTLTKEEWMDKFLGFVKDYATTHAHFKGDEVISAFRREHRRDEPDETRWYGLAMQDGKRKRWYSALVQARPTKSRNNLPWVTLWRSHLFPHKSDEFSLSKMKASLRKQALLEGLTVTEVIERAVSMGLSYKEPKT